MNSDAEETTGSATVDPLLRWCGNSYDRILNRWEDRAVGAGESNTTTALTTCESGAIKAARDYRGGSKTDWSLGSLGEVKLMYDNLLGLGGFIWGDYWSSSGGEDGDVWAKAFTFLEGYTLNGYKSGIRYVRPVRAF